MKTFVAIAMLLASTAGATRLLRGSSGDFLAAAGRGGNATGAWMGKSEDWQKDVQTWLAEHPAKTPPFKVMNETSWAYTHNPCMQGKFQRIAQIMKDVQCGPTVGEVGGGENPMDKFNSDASLYVDLEPGHKLTTAEGAGGARRMHLPYLLDEWKDVHDFRAQFGLPVSFDCTLALGVPSVKRAFAGFEEFVSKSQTVIVELMSVDGQREMAPPEQLQSFGFEVVQKELYDCSKDPTWMDARVSGKSFNKGDTPLTREQKAVYGLRHIFVFKRRAAGESSR